jgi:hypothetical protein
MVPVDPQTGPRSHGPIAEQVRTTLSNMQNMLQSVARSNAWRWHAPRPKDITMK